MGQVAYIFDSAVHPPYKAPHKADYAYINRTSGELCIRSAPVVSEQDGLKDVEYIIVDGVLYIKATEVRWGHVSWSEDDFGGTMFKPKYFPITEKDLEKYVIPEDCIVRNVKRGWFGKEELAVEIAKSPHERWFKLKKEYEFEYCMHPFKIYE